MKNLKLPITCLIFTMFLSACQSGMSKQPNLQGNANPMPLVGVQLWSVKDEIKNDFEGTIKKLSAMGFQGVEFARDYGPFAEDGLALKNFLNNEGLLVSGTHVELSEFTEDKFESSVKFYQELGSPMLILAWDERAWEKNNVNDFIVEISALSKKLNSYGLKFGFHNHDQEFNEFQGTTFWDHIALSTPENLIMQLDVGWATIAGKDPVAYVNRYPRRTVSVHYKASIPNNKKNSETNKLPLIGQDVIDWLTLIQTNIAVGTEWIILEQEEYPNQFTPLEAVTISKKGLDRILNKITTNSTLSAN